MQKKVNGIRINFELWGKEDAPVVVLSHSLGSSMKMWDPQLEALEPHYQVLRYDMRGHGRSEAPEGAYTLDLLARDVIGLLDAFGMRTVHFVGLSIGGMIGQCLGLNYPGRLKSLVLCDTASAITQESRKIFQEREQTAREKGMSSLVEATMERWFTQTYLKTNPARVDPIRGQFLATPVSGFVGCSRAIQGLDYLDRLAEIRLPCLVMVGEDDPGTPVAASEAIVDRISGAELKILPSAAHLSNIEQSAKFNAGLLDFLKKH